MRVHFLGIGGSGTSAAAAIAEAQGFKVTGCDLNPYNEFTTQFKKDQLMVGHSASHIISGKVDILATTPALTSLDPENPELLEAKKQGIEVLTWQQFTGKYLMKDKFVIAVTGTHGKTTTTSMIAKVLEDANLDPTVILGAVDYNLKTNHRVGKSKFFLIEADEYNDNFLYYKANIVVVTNIEMDHPEYFKDLEDYENSFFKFLLQTKETVVANLEDAGVSHVLKDVMKESAISCLDYSKNELNINLQIPGKFNIQNAKAAFQVGLLLGINTSNIIQSLESYKGVGRRFEFLGELKEAKIYTDFGHHPTEIKTTMEAAREKFPNSKIWLIYEPHMFTRTVKLFDDFVKVFKGLPVDRIIITDIYQSREVDKGLVTSKQLAEAVEKERVTYTSKKDLSNELKSQLGSGDIVFFMGAGDIDKLAKNFLTA